MQNILKLVDESWHDFFLSHEKLLQEILNKISHEKVPIFPPFEQIFHAFALTPLDKIKLVILGQDPYHGANQAMGLSFGVKKQSKLPPSLRNIFKEIHRDLGVKCSHGDLSSWAKQGVMLLNSSLSVQEGNPNSHKNIGWQIFTDAVISHISKRNDFVVFMLWGNFAKSKMPLIASHHAVLQASHPSPFSAKNFLGCSHFSKANQLLIEHEKSAIEWKL